MTYSPFHIQSTTVLLFFGSSRFDGMAAVLESLCSLQNQFEQYDVSFIGVCIDPGDRALTPQFEVGPACTLRWDLDRTLSIQYGACQDTDAAIEQLDYNPLTVVLDDTSRVLRIFPVQDPEQHIQQVLTFVKELPAFKGASLAHRQAPVLFIPNVFSQEFCQQLIQLYEADGGRDSGFMKPVGDKITEVLDADFKRRRDFTVTDLATLGQINTIIWQRVKPEIEKAFQFSITSFERYVVACYKAENQGCFKLHRDNVVPGTTHRRFAITLNLNSGYEGGCLRFPEYGPYLYRPGIGEAVIFSCGLLHEATPVTTNVRFALLSFFYGDADLQARHEGQKHVRYDQPPGSDTPSGSDTKVRRSRGEPSSGFQGKSTRKSR